jgi:hypothetical protein
METGDEMTPRIIALTTLPELPDGWMKELDTEAEAVQFAISHEQPFIYYFAGNRRYYVAVTK